MVMSNRIEAEVLDWYAQTWNLPGITGKQHPLSPETALNTGDSPWAPEAGDDIMRDFFDRFDVNPAGFDLIRYWPVEKGIIPNFLRPRSKRVYPGMPEPLTLSMLIASAKARRWIY